MSSIKEYDPDYSSKVKYIRFYRGLVKGNKAEDSQYENKYSKFIIGVQEYRQMTWMTKFQWVENYMTLYKKRPVDTGNDEERKMSIWVCNQLKNYKKRKEVMRNQKNYDLWTQLLDKFEDCFAEPVDVWSSHFNDLVNFINIHNRKPACCKKSSLLP